MGHGRSLPERRIRAYTCQQNNRARPSSKKEEYEAHTATGEFLSRAFSSFNAFEGGWATAYVACFCEEGDLLSQWRAYGVGGGGYAIGFDGHQFRHLQLFEPPVNHYLVKVIYETSTQEALIGTLIEGMCTALDGIAGAHGDEAAQDAISPFLEKFGLLATEPLLSFKNPMFAEEREWRIAYVSVLSPFRDDLANVRFRVAGNQILPYVDLDLRSSLGVYSGLLPILEVVHGPTLNPSLTEKSLDLLLRKHNYHFVEVDGSSVPLRL